MRNAILVVGAALIFAASVPAQQNFGTVFNGVTPRPFTFTDITTKKLIKNPIATTSTIRTPAQTKAFSLTNVFPKISTPSWPPKIASTPILPQKSNPFQPNPIFGKNPFAK